MLLNMTSTVRYRWQCLYRNNDLPLLFIFMMNTFYTLHFLKHSEFLSTMYGYNECVLCNKPYAMISLINERVIVK